MISTPPFIQISYYTHYKIINTILIYHKQPVNSRYNRYKIRNIAVHNYQNINIKLIQMIIEKHLADFDEYIDAINKALKI